MVESIQKPQFGSLAKPSPMFMHFVMMGAGRVTCNDESDYALWAQFHYQLVFRYNGGRSRRGQCEESNTQSQDDGSVLEGREPGPDDVADSVDDPTTP